MTIRHTFDRLLDRGTKIVGILGFLWAAYMATSGVLAIPQTLAQNASSIVELNEFRRQTELDLQKLAQNSEYSKEQNVKIEKKVDRIYELISRKP